MTFSTTLFSPFSSAFDTPIAEEQTTIPVGTVSSMSKEVSPAAFMPTIVTDGDTRRFCEQAPKRHGIRWGVLNYDVSIHYTLAWSRRPMASMTERGSGG
jgi:hypothetical protein